MTALRSAHPPLPEPGSRHRSDADAAARLAGIAFMCGAWLSFSGVDASAKYLLASLAVVQVVFLRYAGGLVYSLAVVVTRGVRRPLHTQAFHLQLARGLLLVTSTGLNFVSLSYLRLDQTSAIMFSIPLITCALSNVVLGERAGWRRMAAVYIGFIGVLVIVRPGFASFHWAMLLALVNAVLASLYFLLTRKVARFDRDETSMIYSVLIGTILTLPFALYHWQPLTSATLAPALLIGLFGGIGHQMIVISYRLAPAPVVAPFSYTQIIWMTALGYFLFAQLPDLMTLLGAGIVIGCGLFLIYFESRERRGQGEE